MKKIISALFFATISLNSESAVIKNARLDVTGQNILIDVTYGGGCGEHKFNLQLGTCLESYPVQCTAQLIEKTNDYCEALIAETVTISLFEAGLTDSYYQGAYLRILGGLNSSSTLRLK